MSCSVRTTSTAGDCSGAVAIPVLCVGGGGGGGGGERERERVSRSDGHIYSNSMPESISTPRNACKLLGLPRLA